MISGIAVVGGNGSGKTTLGKCLAKLLGYRYIDVEDYYFKDSAIPYANPRTKEELQRLILKDIDINNGHFVLTSVKGDMGPEINALYGYIVYIQVPPDIRLARVKQRAVDRFGSRVLAGGDMYEQEQDFLHFVAARSLDQTDGWVEKTGLPVIYVDGTEPIDTNARRIMAWLGKA